MCRAGCSSCCNHDLSVFEVEADSVRAAVLRLPGETLDRVTRQAREVQDRKARGESPACPLLVDDRCCIYDSRPIICRTQGLPLLYAADDGNQEVDFCRLNFAQTGATQELDGDHLVPLDALNCRLAALDLRRSLSFGVPANQGGSRKTMSAIILEVARA